MRAHGSVAAYDLRVSCQRAHEVQARDSKRRQDAPRICCRRYLQGMWRECCWGTHSCRRWRPCQTDCPPNRAKQVRHRHGRQWENQIPAATAPQRWHGGKRLTTQTAAPHLLVPVLVRAIAALESPGTCCRGRDQLNSCRPARAPAVQQLLRSLYALFHFRPASSPPSCLSPSLRAWRGVFDWSSPWL
jgi:hypothetical protein